MCTSLLKHITDYKKLLEECLAIGGNKFNESTYDTFLENMSSKKHQVRQQIYQETTLDDDFEYFREK